MAKHVTEDDLATGLRPLGSLGSLSRNRRDSPFRDSRAEVKTVELPAPNEPLTPEPPPVKVATADQPPVEVKPAPPKVVPRKTSQPAPLARPEKTKAAVRKADVFSERVTLQMSPEMRDQLDSIARELQRSKVSKEERITPNTVMRVAIKLFVDDFKLDRGEQVNSEDELLSAMKRKRKEPS